MLAESLLVDRVDVVVVGVTTLELMTPDVFEEALLVNLVGVVVPRVVVEGTTLAVLEEVLLVDPMENPEGPPEDPMEELARESEEDPVEETRTVGMARFIVLVDRIEDSMEDVVVGLTTSDVATLDIFLEELLSVDCVIGKTTVCVITSAVSTEELPSVDRVEEPEAETMTGDTAISAVLVEESLLVDPVAGLATIEVSTAAVRVEKALITESVEDVGVKTIAGEVTTSLLLLRDWLLLEDIIVGDMVVGMTTLLLMLEASLVLGNAGVDMVAVDTTTRLLLEDWLLLEVAGVRTMTDDVTTMLSPDNWLLLEDELLLLEDAVAAFMAVDATMLLLPRDVTKMVLNEVILLISGVVVPADKDGSVLEVILDPVLKMIRGPLEEIEEIVFEFSDETAGSRDEVDEMTSPLSVVVVDWPNEAEEVEPSFDEVTVDFFTESEEIALPLARRTEDPIVEVIVTIAVDPLLEREEDVIIEVIVTIIVGPFVGLEEAMTRLVEEASV